MFETRQDIRFFLSRLARAVRRGDLEVHAYCILPTHFHLLVRSPLGRLSEGMRRVENEYSRRFNRARRRDGALVRGRFRSKPVLSLAYRCLLVGYVDANPVAARLVEAPWLYPWGSASHYSRSSSGPPWLTREWVHSEVCARFGLQSYRPDAYRRALGRSCTDGQVALVNQRLDSNAREESLDDLIGASPLAVRAWMERKLALADGRSQGLPVVDATNLARTCQRLGQQWPEWTLAHRRTRLTAMLVLEAGRNETSPERLGERSHCERSARRRTASNSTAFIARSFSAILATPTGLRRLRTQRWRSAIDSGRALLWKTRWGARSSRTEWCGTVLFRGASGARSGRRAGRS